MEGPEETTTYSSNQKSSQTHHPNPRGNNMINPKENSLENSKNEHA